MTEKSKARVTNASHHKEAPFFLSEEGLNPQKRLSTEFPKKQETIQPGNSPDHIKFKPDTKGTIMGQAT